MRSNNDMGQSQAIGLTVVGVTISLVLWSGLARVAASNERLAASKERLAAITERNDKNERLAASKLRLAQSKERLAASNERLAAAMNAQRAYAPTPDSNQKGAGKVSVWGDNVVTIRRTFRTPFAGRTRWGTHQKHLPVPVETYSPYPARPLPGWLHSPTGAPNKHQHDHDRGRNGAEKRPNQPINPFLPPSKNPFAKVSRPHAPATDPGFRGPLLSFNTHFPGRLGPWIKPGRVIVHEAQDRQARP